MKPTPREAKLIHEKYDKVVKHLIDEKYAVDKDAADTVSYTHLTLPTSQLV